MGIKTKIEWADSTVNPIMGCTGCALRKDHCYAATLCTRYAGCKGWPKSFDEPEFFPGRLERAIRWSNLTGKTRLDESWLNGLPRHIFVNDLSDGFCPDVDAYGWLLPHLDAMGESPHIWLLLTKWPDRMQEFFASVGSAPDNFYLGTSIENQAAADERIPWLLRTPGAVRFVSVEPYLSAVDLSPWLPGYIYKAHGKWVMNTITGRDLPSLDWVIAGGESGPGARPMHPDWARSLRDQCQVAGIPYFFKQWGAWLPYDKDEHEGTLAIWQDRADWEKRIQFLHVSGVNGPFHKEATTMIRVGKKRAGHLLDGRTWQEFPVQPTGAGDEGRDR